jgi:hypothetical protein
MQLKLAAGGAHAGFYRFNKYGIHHASTIQNIKHQFLNK